MLVSEINSHILNTYILTQRTVHSQSQGEERKIALSIMCLDNVFRWSRDLSKGGKFIGFFLPYLNVTFLTACSVAITTLKSIGRRLLRSHDWSFLSHDLYLTAV